MPRPLAGLAVLLAATSAASAEPQALLLKPARVFDGESTHADWAVLVRGSKIAAAGPDIKAADGARTIELPGMTLLPGLIDAHSHLFLRPYDQMPWNDQVLKEAEALR